MADSELADLTAATTLADDDLFYAVRDPAGTPVDRKITVANTRTALGVGYDAPILASGWYVSWGGLASNGESSAIPDTINYFLRFPVSRACTLDRIGLEITVAEAATVVRLGIYGDTNGKPGTLILDAGTIDSSGTGFLTKTISQAITPGIIWLCACPQGGSAVKWRVSDGGDPGGGGSTTGLSASQYARQSFYETVAGALPGTATPLDGSTGNAVRPRVIVRPA
jgi:hypothetical protein